jgi:hypothetical protein
MVLKKRVGLGVDQFGKLVLTPFSVGIVRAMASAGVLERSEKRAFLDDTTPLVAKIVTNRMVPKQNYVVSKPGGLQYEIQRRMERGRRLRGKELS